MTAKGFVILFCFVCGTAGLFGQTQMIAHKSHSGQESTFRVSNELNVGIVEWVDSVIQISDTSFAVVWNFRSRRDTQSLNDFMHGDPIVFDSLKNVYTGPVIFVPLEQEMESSSSMSKKEQRKLKRQEKRGHRSKSKSKKKNNIPLFPNQSFPNGGGTLLYLYLLTGLLFVGVFYLLWRNQEQASV